jgi:serine/threonine-protein kinase
VSTAKKVKGPQDLVIVPAGRYKALKKLAETQSAELFLAEHVGVSGLRRLHVLKRLRTPLSGEAAFRVTLAETAREAMALHHGNLVGVLDGGDASGRPFIVLELVEGWSLDQLMWRARTAQHPLPWQLAVYLAIEAARGLAFLHRPAHGPLREGVVHGDISPMSVLLSEHGELKLGDWCVAHARARQSGEAVTVGKAPFASPELALAEPADSRSDLFALGSLLYWLLADVPPFRGNGEREILSRVEAIDCAPLLQLRPALPKELTRVVTTAMQRDPGHRFQTAGELRAALEAVSSRERCGRSELETWLASLARRDGRGPAAGEVRPNIVVPLRTVKEPPRPVKEPLAPAAAPSLRWKKKRIAAAGFALVALGFGAARLFHHHPGPPTAAAAPIPPAPPPPDPIAPPMPPAEPVKTTPPPRPELDVTLEDTVVVPGDARGLTLDARVDSVSDDRAVVRLESDPPGTTVMLDDRTLGATPFTFRFKVGIPFALRFTHDGFAPQVRWLTVHSPEEVALTLPPGRQ